MTAIVTELQSYQNKRRFANWKPTAPKVNRISTRVTSDADKVVMRCLHFLPLELQVSDWCQGCIELPEEVNSFLIRNAKDESKHDTVLRMLSDYYGVDDVPAAASSLMNRWHSLDCHPVLAAYTLEMGVFFSILPTLIKHGDVYAATVAQWINDDERVHVETNLRILRELGLKVTEDLAILVFNTVGYIYEPMGTQVAREQATRAVKRLVTGRDKQMLTDSLPVTVAYFEQESNQSIVY